MPKSEVIYVRTPSTYGDTHSLKFIELNKIYKAVRILSGVYEINTHKFPKDCSDTPLLICIEQCAWLAFYNDWEVVTEEEYLAQENHNVH